MRNVLKRVEAYIRKMAVADVPGDRRFYAEAEEKLKSVIANGAAECDAASYAAMVKDINEFATKDAASLRKLCLYCMDFRDPSIKFAEKEVVKHSYFSEREIDLLHNFVNSHRRDKSFGEAVYELMDKHNMKAPEVYNNVNMDRRQFSRVTSPAYSGIKRITAWSVIVGLHCNLEEADYLLYCAGYVRRNTKFDLIMEYFIVNRIYDINTINGVLLEEKQKLLYSPAKDDVPRKNLDDDDIGVNNRKDI